MEPLTSTERMERGTQQLAALLNHWLSRGSLSHDKLAAIIHWAIGETSGFDGGTLSRIRNGKQTRGAGLRHLDGIAEANRAIWVWQQEGEAAAIKEFGNYSSWHVRPEWVTDAIWLPQPADATKPLDLGDLAMLLVGRLQLPYLNGQISAGQAKRMNDRLAELLDGIATDRGWGPREAIRQFLEAYPPEDRARQHRLRELLMGEQLTQADLEVELAALAEMIRRVRGVNTFGPAELQAELLSDHQ
jgi:hypothetical protein